MEKAFLPLFAVQPVVLGRKTVFHTITEKIVVETPRKLIRRLIEVCNGFRSLDEIIQLLKNEWEEHSVGRFVGELCRRGILVDSRYFSAEMWKVVENPSRFPVSITSEEVVALVERARKRHRWQFRGKLYRVSKSPLRRLLEQRRSVRVFSGKPVGAQNVFDILWSAYGEMGFSRGKRGSVMDGRRAVPSAGALYPLTIHVAFLKKTGDLMPGIYEVYLGRRGRIGFRSVSDDILRFSRTFLNPVLLEGAHGVVVISGSLHITGKKYGNRAMLYVPLEAGHAAQNIHLAAVEQKVASIEIGGFVEKLLAEAIELSGQYHPLTTVVFGYEEERNIPQSPKLEVQWTVPMAGDYRPSFITASARVSAKRNWSHGRDASPKLAHVKAIAEAKEWAACGCVPGNLLRAKLADLENAIDPRAIIRFHPAQYRLKNFPFRRFDEQCIYEWTEGNDEITGSRKLILADLVYFPYYPETPYHAYANSSGVAAHPDRSKAVETSVLELVERDSFMNAYLGKLASPTVSEKTLPRTIQKRLAELRKQGFQVWVKDHSLDLAPAVFILAQNEKLTCTTCASCVSFDTECATDHALMEVEAFVLARLQNGPAKPIAPHEVAMPLDHGRLYEQKRYFHRADFLVHGQHTIEFRDVGKNAARSWGGLFDRFAERKWSLITIRLLLSDELGGDGDLHIVRSIVPGMVPMTFGYRQEPAGMERIYAMNKRFGDGKLSYHTVTKFPHPFA